MIGFVPIFFYAVKYMRDENLGRPSYDGLTLMGKGQTGAPFMGYVCIPPSPPKKEVQCVLLFLCQIRKNLTIMLR